MSKFRDKILMCPPDYFTVDYVINPWMAGHESSLDIKLARKQWKKLRDSLAEYADIVTIDPQPDLPDMVFTLRHSRRAPGRRDETRPDHLSCWNSKRNTVAESHPRHIGSTTQWPTRPPPVGQHYPGHARQGCLPAAA
jgi:hypothetical protein